KLLDAGLIYPISDSPWDSIDYRKLNEATRNDHFPLPFMDQILERLAGNEFYCFLDGFFGYFQIPIDPRDQEKTMFTCPYGTFTYRRMPFDKMLQRCEDTNLSLNWEKSHFIVKEGIVLGHKISKNGIEVDKAKIDVIAKLPHPTTVKDCIKAFPTLKKKLTEAPILISPNWDLPFELMCDASDFAIGAVLGQRHEKHFKPIHYDSKTMNDVESNYTTTEKEMLVVLYAFEKLWSYLIMNKSIVHTDHSALKYLFAKKDAKARLLWSLIPVSFGPPSTRMPTSLSNTVTRANDKEKFHNVEAKALPTNDARVVCKFLKSLFARFGTPRAIISDRGTHFCNDQFAKVMLKYEVTHRLSTAYYPQTSGQVEVSNRGLKRILERTIVKLSQVNEPNFKVNGHRVKHYFGGDVPQLVVSDL
nr:reverse transcriptase domain-containing protein [Tanacetum cinerariifolium]